jgi:hypothetical protein
MTIMKVTLKVTNFVMYWPRSIHLEHKTFRPFMQKDFIHKYYAIND